MLPKPQHPKLKPLLDSRYQVAACIGLLLWILGAGAAGLLKFDSLTFWGCWLIVAGLYSASLFLAQQSQALIRLGLAACCFLLGGTTSQYWEAFHPVPDLTMWQDGLPHRVEAIARREWRASSFGNVRWIVEIKKIDSEPAIGQLLLSLPKTSQPLQNGEKCRFAGEISMPEEGSFPGDFSYQAYLETQGIQALARANFIDDLGPEENWLNMPLNTLMQTASWARQQIMSTFQAYLSPPEAELLGSIVLGEHAVGMSEETKDRFRGLGLSHVLAASGLNLGIVGGFVLCLGMLCRLPNRLNLSIAMATVFVYALMTGLPPSILRAGMMFEIALLLKFFYRQLSASLVLCLAAWVLAIFNPHILLQLGFQLSFLSTFGLIVMSPPLCERLNYWAPKWLVNIIVIPAVAQIWVLPIQLSVFQEASLMALPANILVLPLVGLLTMLGFLSGGISLISPILASPLLVLSGFLLQSLDQLTTNLPNMSLAIGLSNPFWAILLYSLLVLSTFWLYRPPIFTKNTQFSVFFATFLLLLIPFSLEKWQHEHPVVMVISQAESGLSNILIRQSSDHASLILNLLDWKSLASTKNLLKKQQITQLDLLFITSNPQVSQKKLSTTTISQFFEHLHPKQIVLAGAPIPLKTTKTTSTTLENELIQHQTNSQINVLNTSSEQSHYFSVTTEHSKLLAWLLPETIAITLNKTPLLIRQGSSSQLADGLFVLDTLAQKSNANRLKQAQFSEFQMNTPSE